jgi:hypothetical protein
METMVHAVLEAAPALFASFRDFDLALPGLVLGALGGWYVTGALEQRRLKKQKAAKRRTPGS